MITLRSAAWQGAESPGAIASVAWRAELPSSHVGGHQDCRGCAQARRASELLSVACRLLRETPQRRGRSGDQSGPAAVAACKAVFVDSFTGWVACLHLKTLFLFCFYALWWVLQLPSALCLCLGWGHIHKRRCSRKRPPVCGSSRTTFCGKCRSAYRCACVTPVTLIAIRSPARLMPLVVGLTQSCPRRSSLKHSFWENNCLSYVLAGTWSSVAWIAWPWRLPQEDGRRLACLARNWLALAHWFFLPSIPVSWTG